jgi:hypothetical protein
MSQARRIKLKPYIQAHITLETPVGEPPIYVGRLQSGSCIIANRDKSEVEAYLKANGYSVPY